jgi:hypothetical protein
VTAYQVPVPPLTFDSVPGFFAVLNPVGFLVPL